MIADGSFKDFLEQINKLIVQNTQSVGSYIFMIEDALHKIDKVDDLISNESS